MTFVPGAHLGPYQILGLLGAGGMGEVYRARDPRLGRDVAIKVLPADRMGDESRRARFVQEARAASSLNHPNIVTVHEIGSAGDVDFIVMECVAGRTLDRLLRLRRLSLGETLRLAIQIAGALARAHSAGIVHRDLKPSNVAVSEEGLVKILDFGLAKLVSPEEPGEESGSDSRETEPASFKTRSGMVVGTAGYMSPEQASGGKVDARSDVFAFGAVLYEMVTAQRAFGGASSGEILAAVMRDEPKPPSELVPGLPRELERLIQRCLKKDPARRFQHTRDLELELEQIQEEMALVPAVRRSSPRWHGARLGLLLVATLGLAAATAWWRSAHVAGEEPHVVQVTSMLGDEWCPTLSPDGEQLAFSWNGEKRDNFDIYLKAVGSSDLRRLTTDPRGEFGATWSPDGALIAYLRHEPEGGSRIHLISPVSGADRKLSDFPNRGDVSWSPDSRWLATTIDDSAEGEGARPDAGTFYLLPANGGEARAVRVPEESERLVNPTFSPDGRRLAYFTQAGVGRHVVIVDLGPDYAPVGPPRRVTTRPVWAMDDPVWTRDGRSILYSDWAVQRLWRVGVSGDRAPQVVGLAGLRTARPAMASRRDRLVYSMGYDTLSIYRFQAHSPSQPVIASSYADVDPAFSSDGRRVAFASARSGAYEIWTADADGANPRQLTDRQGVLHGSPAWSPDDRRVAFDAQDEDGTWYVWTIDADGGSPRRLTNESGNENLPSWSRDGRHVYFARQRASAASPGTAPYELRRVPVAGGAEERIAEGGAIPGRSRESIDGTTLFFLRRPTDQSPSLIAQPLAGGPEREVARSVFAFALVEAGLYTIEWDGAPALYLRESPEGPRRRIGSLESSNPASPGVAVSPDGQTVLYNGTVGNAGSDLVMIDGFR